MNWLIKISEIENNISCCETWSNSDKVHILYILKSNGIKDAMWALRYLPYRQYCLFLAQIAEEIALPIWEARYPDDPRLRKFVDAIRKWHAGEINNEDLKKAADAAAAADAAVYAAADVAGFVVETVANSAIYAAARAATYNAANAADLAACTAAIDAWQKIEKMFVNFVKEKEAI